MRRAQCAVMVVSDGAPMDGGSSQQVGNHSGEHVVQPNPATMTAEAEALLRHLYAHYPRRVPRVVDSPEEVLADPEKLRKVRAANLRRLFDDGKALDDLVEDLWDEARKGGVLGALRHAHDLLEDGRRAPSVLVLKALDIFVVHHPRAIEARLRIPPLCEHNRFIRGNDVVNASPDRPTTARFQPDVVDTSWFQPEAPCEESLGYWTEDYDRNASHTKWHVVYYHGGIPDLESPREGARRFVLDRQGEQFLYMHQQMMARYAAERLCWGLPPVVPFDDYREIIRDGYEPPRGLLQANRYWQFPFIARPGGHGLHESIEGYDGADTTVPNLEVTPEGAAVLFPWLAINRGDLTVFVHLVTGDEMWDHVHNAFWMGEMLPLVNLECLENPLDRPLDAMRAYIRRGGG